MSAAPAACPFCEIATKRPELVVAETERWVLIHVDRLFGLGSLFLISRDHVLTPQLGADDWADAAPLLSGGSRAITEMMGAQRVYLAVFLENIEHFHMTMFCKHLADVERHGARGPALLDAVTREGRQPSDDEIAAVVAKYRAYLNPR